MAAPPDEPLSALPSPLARATAFAAICLAGLAGGLIGYSLVELQCDGDCALPLGLGIFAGAVVAAGGMSIVAVLVLRAIGESARTAGPTPPMTTVSDALLDELLSLACRLAVEAGDLALAGRRGRSGLSTSTKSTATDLVTIHDRAAEQAVVAGIAAARPNDGIVGEEGTNRPTTSGVSWYVDPIDGTTNFVYDLPAWSTSVAAGDADGMLVGAVYVPAVGELYAAALGQGATLDGRPIRCSAQQELALALVATGFGYDPAHRRRQAGRLQRLIGSVRDIRRFGSAALDLCFVAAGRCDAYYEEGLNTWDMAAGELIAREAGCRTGDFGGGLVDPQRLLVAAPAIFDGMTALLAEPPGAGDER